MYVGKDGWMRGEGGERQRVIEGERAKERGSGERERERERMNARMNA